MVKKVRIARLNIPMGGGGAKKAGLVPTTGIPSSGARYMSVHGTSSLSLNKINSISPQNQKSFVYAGSNDGNLYAFKTSDGTPVWTNPALTGGPIYTSLVLST
jgi:outer membrane protein assembly factor BamB